MSGSISKPVTDELPADKTRYPLLTRVRLTTAVLALGGMIVGALVGIAVQIGVESTGLLGPSVEALFAEQQSNFEDVNDRLEAIRSMSTDPEVRKSLAELGRILDRQHELSQHAQGELSYLTDQVALLKEQQLAESGFAGGADFWLKNGESVSIGGTDQVFGLISARSNIADVNLSGARKRLTIGDALPASGATADCTILYKQAKPRGDGRVGFDLSCS